MMDLNIYLRFRIYKMQKTRSFLKLLSSYFDSVLALANWPPPPRLATRYCRTYRLPSSLCGSVTDLVRALSLGSKGPEFDPSMRSSVVKIAIIANSIRLLCRCLERKGGPSLIA